MNERSVYVCKHQVKQRDFRKGTTALLAKPQFSLSYNLSLSWQALTFGGSFSVFLLENRRFSESKVSSQRERTESFRLGKTEVIRVAIFGETN